MCGQTTHHRLKCKLPQRTRELEYIDSFLGLVWLICTLSILWRRGCVENFVPRIILDYESVTVVQLDTVILRGSE